MVARALSSEEEALLSLVGEHDGRMVYADWLEERAQTKRAAIVRLHDRIVMKAGETAHATWGDTPESRKKTREITSTERALLDDGVELMREVLELSDPSFAAWAERLSAPYSLVATCWFGVESDGTRLGAHFEGSQKTWDTTQQKVANVETPSSAWAASEGLTSRLLSYVSRGSRYANGVWRQVGPVVAFNLNQGYAYHIGALFGPDRIYGAAHNRHDQTWTWRIARITKDEYDDTDGDHEGMDR